MKVKMIIPLFLLSVFSIRARAQNNNELSIGDSVPSFKFTNLLNAKTKVISLANFKDRLLILDFWLTSCPSCVEGLPQMERLQNYFNKQVSILPVTTEKKNVVLDFLNHNKFTKGLTLPILVEDKTLKTTFKHKFVSHEVWIYKGKVIAITDAEYVDKKNIQNVLDGQPVTFPVKYDFYTYDQRYPIFKVNQSQIGNDSVQLQYTAMSDFREKFSSPFLSGISGIYRDSLNKTLRSYILNSSIYSAYVFNLLNVVKLDTLIKPRLYLDSNQIVFEVQNKSRIRYEKKYGYQNDWIRKNGICFESLDFDKGQDKVSVSQATIDGLNRMLGLSARWERRTEKVYYLERSKQKKPDNSRLANDAEITINDVIYKLNQHEGNPYTFNKTQQTSTKIFLDTTVWNNLDYMRKSLLKAGYKLRDTFQAVDKLVFKDVRGGRIVDVSMQNESRIRENKMAALSDPTSEENINFLRQNKTKTDVHTTESGLQYLIVVQGTGPVPSVDDSVVVHYEGKLINGKVFDDSYRNGRPATLLVRELVKGLSEILTLMPVGSHYRVFIPANLGYGTHTGQGKFPPNSTLVFDIELIKINTRK